jgi:hypothetical protein
MGFKCMATNQLSKNYKPASLASLSGKTIPYWPSELYRGCTEISQFRLCAGRKLKSYLRFRSCAACPGKLCRHKRACSFASRISFSAVLFNLAGQKHRRLRGPCDQSAWSQRYTPMGTSIMVPNGAGQDADKVFGSHTVAYTSITIPRVRTLL